MRERQARLLLEINSLVAKIQNAPARTTEDFLALLDVALEHELDLACDIAFYGPADYPIITRLLRILAVQSVGVPIQPAPQVVVAPGRIRTADGAYNTHCRGGE